MAETLTEVLAAVHRNHRANWQWNHCDGGRCDWTWTADHNLPPLPDHEAHVAAHLADAVRAWLLGQREVVAKSLLKPVVKQSVRNSFDLPVIADAVLGALAGGTR